MKSYMLHTLVNTKIENSMREPNKILCPCFFKSANLDLSSSIMMYADLYETNILRRSFARASVTVLGAIAAYLLSQYNPCWLYWDEIWTVLYQENKN